MPNHVRLALSLLFLAPVLGCQESNLEGDWEGELDCGPAGSPDVEVEIEETDDYEYEGLGIIEKLELDGELTEIAFKWDFVQQSKWGGQALRVDAECYAVPESSDSYQLDCSDVEEIGWDGVDTMGAEVEGFLGTDTDCDLELER